MYGMALIFLVLLYKSPAGLVFYWTLNNLFSLFKNVFYKLKDPGKILRICASLAGLFLLGYFLLHPFPAKRVQFLGIVCALLLELPLLLSLLGAKAEERAGESESAKEGDRLFLLCGIFLTILTGVLIPSAVIKASPSEFVNIKLYRSPLWYIASSFLMAAGTFIVWFGIFYRIANEKLKRTLRLGLWLLLGVAAVNYMFFGTNYGDLSSTLVYDLYPQNNSLDYLVNLAVLAAVALVFLLIWKKKRAIVRAVGVALCLAVFAMSVLNIASIQKEMKEVKRVIAETSKDTPAIPLSKEGKNVVVIMLDRAVGYYVPFIMDENAKLKAQFEGFTLYPNAVTYGSATDAGAPALFGGYEYRPSEINKRVNDSLAEKHNEALRVMPVLFDEAGYEVTVMDPPYAGYKDPADLSIYDDHPDIHAYIARGKFAVESDFDVATEISRHRNFFCFSIYKTAPLVLQPTLYSDGFYNEADALANVGRGSAASKQTLTGMNKATGLTSRFLECYAVLHNLANITEIQDSGDTFLMMDTDQTHELILTQLPDYTPATVVDNTPYEPDQPVRYAEDGRVIRFSADHNTRQITAYHTEMVALMQLGNWFDYLRANDLYDNTRIIIVSDHGCCNMYFSDMMFGKEKWEDVTAYNCVLLEKDFNSKEFSVDNTFMTNADVPTMAFQSLIEDPVNPATGKPILDSPKYEEQLQIQFVLTWDIKKNNGNTFLPAEWVSVHDNIFDLNNWSSLGNY